jgi:hypothetical protein
VSTRVMRIRMKEIRKTIGKKRKRKERGRKSDEE